MRDLVDRLSFRARTAIIAVVFALTVLAIMDDLVQSVVGELALPLGTMLNLRQPPPVGLYGGVNRDRPQ